MSRIKIIAEIGWNFLGDIDLAKKMIVDAKNAGANIAKFQYWDPATLKKGSWDEDGRRQIYEKAALDERKINILKKICDEEEINSLFSVFTLKSAEKLKLVGEKNIKIPSHEINNKELIKFAGDNFDFVFLSTGASIEKEVIDATKILKSSKSEFNLMHCVSSYPCELSSSNLPRINWLKLLHDKVGLSDHTQSTLPPALAVSMGATVIEKHFTSNNNLDGRDNKFALNPENFKKMVNLINETEKCLNYLGNNYLDSESDTVENYRGRWG